MKTQIHIKMQEVRAGRVHFKSCWATVQCLDIQASVLFSLYFETEKQIPFRADREVFSGVYYPPNPFPKPHPRGGLTE